MPGFYCSLDRHRQQNIWKDKTSSCRTRRFFQHVNSIEISERVRQTFLSSAHRRSSLRSIRAYRAPMEFEKLCFPWHWHTAMHSTTNQHRIPSELFVSVMACNDFDNYDLCTYHFRIITKLPSGGALANIDRTSRVCYLTAREQQTHKHTSTHARARHGSLHFARRRFFFCFFFAQRWPQLWTW